MYLFFYDYDVNLILRAQVFQLKVKNFFCIYFVFFFCLDSNIVFFLSKLFFIVVLK